MSRKVQQQEKARMPAKNEMIPGTSAFRLPNNARFGYFCGFKLKQH
jgi:hypothetical protein